MRTRKELRLTMMPGQAIDLVRTLVLGVLGPALLLGGCASFDRQPFEAAQIEACARAGFAENPPLGQFPRPVDTDLDRPATAGRATARARAVGRWG